MCQSGLNVCLCTQFLHKFYPKLFTNSIQSCAQVQSKLCTSLIKVLYQFYQICAPVISKLCMSLIKVVHQFFRVVCQSFKVVHTLYQSRATVLSKLCINSNKLLHQFYSNIYFNSINDCLTVIT